MFSYNLQRSESSNTEHPDEGKASPGQSNIANPNLFSVVNVAPNVIASRDSLNDFFATESKFRRIMQNAEKRARSRNDEPFTTKRRRYQAVIKGPCSLGRPPD